MKVMCVSVAVLLNSVLGYLFALFCIYINKKGGGFWHRLLWPAYYLRYGIMRDDLRKDVLNIDHRHIYSHEYILAMTVFGPLPKIVLNLAIVCEVAIATIFMLVVAVAIFFGYWILQVVADLGTLREIHFRAKELFWEMFSPRQLAGVIPIIFIVTTLYIISLIKR